MAASNTAIVPRIEAVDGAGIASFWVRPVDGESIKCSNTSINHAGRVISAASSIQLATIFGGHSGGYRVARLERRTSRLPNTALKKRSAA